ncbi:hypothetical protein K9090_001480 [Campylobacter upsaliensis]|nr:hypothetical protein [Campylobacter upsaliensis]
MNKVDVMANTVWAIGDDYGLNLVERKLDKFSSEQLKQFDSRMDELNLREASKLKILTFFFGAFGIARFMTGQKVAGWIRIFILIAMLIVPKIMIQSVDIHSDSDSLVGVFMLFGGGALLIGLKILIVILWIWDFAKADDLAYNYNFYQIMGLIRDIENK